VKGRISNRRHRIKNVEQIAVEEMSKFKEDLLEKLALSFHTRMELCIKAKGRAIKY